MLNSKGLAAARPWPVYLMAFAVPLSMAATSIAKALVLLAALAVLLHGLARGKRSADFRTLASPALVLAMLAALGLSLAWTDASASESLAGLVKYGKLLVIPLVLVLLRDRREALVAMRWYLGAETFVLFSSILLGVGVPLPWRVATQGEAAVFSAYLDQSIMTAGFAAICWHLRREFPGRWGPSLATALAVLALVNVIFQMPGRTGYVSALAALTLALYWEFPRRWRLGAAVLPTLLVALAMIGSVQFKERTMKLIDEVQAYEQLEQVGASTSLRLNSTGLRLNMWRSATEAIAERPGFGWGVGSWPRQYVQRDQGRDPLYNGSGGNPHQEFLLWGVHLGVPGIALMIALLCVLARDSCRIALAEQRALLTLIALLTLACLFNSTLYDALIGDYFCILIGVLLALGMRPAAKEATA